jgi:hypothetical protein
LAEALDYQERVNGAYPTRIWRLVAFLGRYAHQPAAGSLSLPVDDLIRLSRATGYYLDKESEATRTPQ